MNEAKPAPQLLNNVIERINDGFVALDNNWCYTYINSRAARLLQRDKPEDLIGKHIWTEYPEGIDQPFHRAYMKAKQTQQPVIFEEYFAPWDQWFENRIYPSEDGLTIYFTDISIRKRAERSLSRVNRALRVISDCNEALLRSTQENTLFEDICDAIVRSAHYEQVWAASINRDENTLNVIAQCGFDMDDLGGLARSKMYKEALASLINTSLNKEKACVIQPSTDNAVSQSIQAVKEKYSISASVILPVIVSGEIYATLNISLSEEDNFDAEEVLVLQELAVNLAYRITALRAEIEHRKLQRQLQQAQKMEAIGQLTGGIAHDFNNILAIIMGYSDMALRRSNTYPDAKLVANLNEICRASTRARDLVKNMLAFSQNAGANARPVLLEPAVREIVKLLQATMPSSVELQIEADITLPNIMMDDVHLHQIVMNLCINARDAMAGEGVIRISLLQTINSNTECHTCHQHVTGDYVELAVNDTGSGITMTDMEKIFEPFYSTKETGKGSGMGLSVVHGLVHEHGGHILVDTQAGKGSHFRLLFPVTSHRAEHDETNTTSSSSDTSPASKSGHILLIDDDAGILTLLTEILQLEGFRVTAKASSSDALEHFRLNPQGLDLVITDQTMPGYSGAELATEMLRIRADIPIILCTGYSEMIDAEKAETLGIKRFLQKPVSHQTLLLSINALLPSLEKIIIPV